MSKNIEKYVHGRKAGVAHNQNKEVRNGTPKTTPTDRGDHDVSGSQDAELSRAASSVYGRAKAPVNDPSKIGDQAVFVR